MPNPGDFYRDADPAYVQLDQPFLLSWSRDGATLVGRSGAIEIGRVVPDEGSFSANLGDRVLANGYFREEAAVRLVERQWQEEASNEQLSAHLISLGEHVEGRLTWTPGTQVLGHPGDDRIPFPGAPWQTRLLQWLASALPGRMRVGHAVTARGRAAFRVKDLGVLDRPLQALVRMLPTQGEIDFSRSIDDRQAMLERRWLLQQIRWSSHYASLLASKATDRAKEDVQAILSLTGTAPVERAKLASQLPGDLLGRVDAMVGREIRLSQPEAWAFAAGAAVAQVGRSR